MTTSVERAAIVNQEALPEYPCYGSIWEWCNSTLREGGPFYYEFEKGGVVEFKVRRTDDGNKLWYPYSRENFDGARFLWSYSSGPRALKQGGYLFPCPACGQDKPIEIGDYMCIDCREKTND